MDISYKFNYDSESMDYDNDSQSFVPKKAKLELPEGWTCTEPGESIHNFNAIFRYRVLKKHNFFHGPKNPIDFFHLFISEELILKITGFTNIRAQQHQISPKVLHFLKKNKIQTRKIMIIQMRLIYVISDHLQHQKSKYILACCCI
jgi:hypothetical protein